MRKVVTIPISVVFMVLARLLVTPEACGQTEESLEEEFQLQREKLGALPSYSGADAESKFRLAEELGRRGDMRGAIETYREAIRLEPNWAEPYRGLGQVLLDHHDYKDAVQALHTGISLGSHDHLALYWLGRGLMGTGDLSDAEQALEQALEQKPDDAETLADLGLVRMARGNPAGSEEALRRSIELKPDNADAHRLGDQLRRVKGDPEKTRQAGLQILHDIFGRE